MTNMRSIIIFASGNGSNARAIYQHGLKTKSYQVAAICSDKKFPGVRSWAESMGIPFHYIPVQSMPLAATHEFIFYNYQPTLVVLAGYLRLIPLSFIQFFNGQIINIHPALLPNFGGKGMYGHFVHEAVITQKQTESGLTIHWVNEQYDQGTYICQVHVPVYHQDTAQNLADRVLKQEHIWYPRMIVSVLNPIQQARN
jgi:phosphoribosylglycinamide formyltransferase 1